MAGAGVADKHILIVWGNLAQPFGPFLDPGERAAKRIGKGGSYFASPVAGDGKIYLASADGTVTVLKNDASYEELAQNELGESILGTPAIADGRLFVRTRTQVLCFAADPPARGPR